MLKEEIPSTYIRLRRCCRLSNFSLRFGQVGSENNVPSRIPACADVAGYSNFLISSDYELRQVCDRIDIPSDLVQ